MKPNSEIQFNPEQIKQRLQYSDVEQPQELDQLAGRTATSGELSFNFSPTYLEKLKHMLEEPNAYQTIATSEKGEFAGYVGASESLFPGYLFLAELFVDPALSGKGIGSELVRKVIDKAKLAGLKGVMTQTEYENLPAQALYEKLGFKKVENPNSNDLTYQLVFKKQD